MADTEWLRRTALYLGFHEMPPELVAMSMELRKLHPFDAMCELRLMLRLPVVA